MSRFWLNYLGVRVWKDRFRLEDEEVRLIWLGWILLDGVIVDWLMCLRLEWRSSVCVKRLEL